MFIFQLFDRNDKELLAGSSPITARSKWVELSSWRFGDKIDTLIIGGDMGAWSGTLARAFSAGEQFAKAVIRGYVKIGGRFDWRQQIEMRVVLLNSFVSEDKAQFVATLSFTERVMVFQDPKPATGGTGGASNPGAGGP